jgi:hypothetical protein
MAAGIHRQINSPAQARKNEPKPAAENIQHYSANLDPITSIVISAAAPMWLCDASAQHMTPH